MNKIDCFYLKLIVSTWELKILVDKIWEFYFGDGVFPKPLYTCKIVYEPFMINL